MNEEDLNQTESKETKPKTARKTAKTKTTAGMEKKTTKTAAVRKRVSVKAADLETEPKVKKTRTRRAAKTSDVKTTAAKKNTEDTTPTAKKRTRAKATTKAKTSTEKIAPLSSVDSVASEVKSEAVGNTEVIAENAAPEVELSPVFKELAEPKLPVLREENRAYLQMQSPTRLFFYWSLKNSSYNTLYRALGSRSEDYFLAVRLVDLNGGQTELHRIENRGSWWFNNIQADTKYRAEVGFIRINILVRIVFKYFGNSAAEAFGKYFISAVFRSYRTEFAEVLI